MEGSQDRSSGWELEAGAEAEIGKEQDSLIRCPRFAQPAVLYTQDHLSRGGTAHAGMDPPTSIMNWEKASQAYPQANLVEAFSQYKFPDDLAGVKLTKS